MSSSVYRKHLRFTDKSELANIDTSFYVLYRFNNPAPQFGISLIFCIILRLFVSTDLVGWILKISRIHLGVCRQQHIFLITPMLHCIWSPSIKAFLHSFKSSSMLESAQKYWAGDHQVVIPSPTITELLRLALEQGLEMVFHDICKSYIWIEASAKC